MMDWNPDPGSRLSPSALSTPCHAAPHMEEASQGRIPMCLELGLFGGRLALNGYNEKPMKPKQCEERHEAMLEAETQSAITLSVLFPVTLKG